MNTITQSLAWAALIIGAALLALGLELGTAASFGLVSAMVASACASIAAQRSRTTGRAHGCGL